MKTLLGSKPFKKDAFHYKGYTSGAESYQRMAADEKRSSLAVNNLKQQFELLEQEPAILN